MRCGRSEEGLRSLPVQVKRRRSASRSKVTGSSRSRFIPTGRATLRKWFFRRESRRKSGRWGCRSSGRQARCEGARLRSWGLIPGNRERRVELAPPEEARVRNSARAGSVLLEVVLAIVLFAAAAAVVGMALKASIDGAQRLRLSTHAGNLAVTVISELQMGLRS